MQLTQNVSSSRKKVIVGVDNGYYGTKISTADKTIYLRSKYEKSNDILNKQDTYLLEYENEDYIVGKYASISSLEYDKTQDELYKIVTYAALSILCNTDEEIDYYLMGSYPLSIYSHNKDHFADYLRGSSAFDTVLNGKPKMFNIIKAVIFPQAVCQSYARLDLFTDQVRGIIDFGSLTVNAVVMDNFNIVPGTAFTEDFGSIILENEIKKKLDKEYTLNLKEYEIKNIIKHGLKIKGKIVESAYAIIKSTINEHLSKIKKSIKANGWNIESLDLFITGGSSLDYSIQLQSIFPQAIMSTDPVNDGAKGLLVVGNLIYGDEVNGK